MPDDRWPRRRFLRSAARVAGLTLAGPGVLAACTDGRESVSARSTPQDSSDRSDRSEPNRSDGTGRRGSSDASDGTNSDGAGDVVVWRLSTRNQRSACKACKAHAANRYYGSAEAADGDRPHPGCACEVREQRAGTGTVAGPLKAAAQVYDIRWAETTTN